MPLPKFFTTLGLVALISLTNPTQLWATPRDVSGSTNAELRMDYLQKLLDSKSGQRLALHNGGETKREIDAMIHKADTAMAAGHHDEADEIAKSALKTLMQAIRELPEDPEEIDRFKKRYKDMRQGLEKFTYAQEDNVERFADEENSAKQYNRAQVDKLLNKAKELAGQEDYEEAIKVLAEAQSIVTSSLQGMLNNKQLVIELDIGTPEKEYAYEVRRYMGYEELIPVAIDVKKPSEMAAKTMLKLGDKAKWMSEQARDKAIEGDYPVAIRMMMDATNVVREALRIAGVYM